MTFSQSDIIFINSGRYLSADTTLSLFPCFFNSFKSKKTKELIASDVLLSCDPEKDYIFVSSVKKAWVKST